VEWKINTHSATANKHIITILCRGALLQKLTVTQLVKKFFASYGARRFIAVFTTARNWPLSSAR